MTAGRDPFTSILSLSTNTPLERKGWNGAERMGMVLAELSLLLRSIRTHIDEIDDTVYWRRTRRELSRYAQNLGCSRVVYENTVKDLLYRIKSEEEFKVLFADPDPGGALRRDIKLEDQLRFRLGYNYGPFMMTLGLLGEALIILGQDLGIEATEKVSPFLPQPHRYK